MVAEVTVTKFDEGFQKSSLKERQKQSNLQTKQKPLKLNKTNKNTTTKWGVANFTHFKIHVIMCM